MKLFNGIQRNFYTKHIISKMPFLHRIWKWIRNRFGLKRNQSKSKDELLPATKIEEILAFLLLLKEQIEVKEKERKRESDEQYRRLSDLIRLRRLNAS